MPIRLTAALAAVALAAGAGTAFADAGHDHGRGDTHDHDHAKVLKADLFGSMPDGPVLFGVKPAGAPWVISRGVAEARRDGSVRRAPQPGAQRHRRRGLHRRDRRVAGDTLPGRLPEGQRFFPGFSQEPASS